MPDFSEPTTVFSLQRNERGLGIMGAHKIGRNAPCPCGSGKKYKLCCLDMASPNHIGFSGTASPSDVVHIFSPHMLMNRVDREAKKIAEHFDALALDQVAEIDRIYSTVGGILFKGKAAVEKDQDELRTALVILLTNALKSYSAAFSLLRSGWRLQPFMCIRNSYETLSVVLHLWSNSEEFAAYKSGKLKSTATFGSAKRLLPHFGKLYGDLSEQFTHVGRPFGYVQRGATFSEDENDLWHCLGQLAFLIWFMYQTVELVFYDYTEQKLFWTKVGEQPRPRSTQLDGVYKLNPTPEAENLKEQLFSFYKKYFGSDMP